ncbi:MAG TPA: type II secretion system protein [Solirubrobacteraceae bacterium]|jgi:prepilin-type N-terminal cleavage/methylation domain-containing protein|nr:type II secretion system protein [Solirubrobacteraceae bacterium]
MSPRTDSQRGFTLIELLLVMSLGIVILGATLTSFTNYYRNNKTSQQLNDSAQVARNSMDLAARQLRNLANQDPSQQTTTIARALPFDLVFQTSDPSRKWVRYCLDTSNTGGAGSSASRGQLWEMETATATAPTPGMMSSCPGSVGPLAGSWVSQRMVADNVTNRIGGVDRPVFSYSCSPLAPSTCPASSADYTRITNIGAQMYIDVNPGKAPAELRVVSSIFLRNQNEAPVADFSATSGGTRTVILNASSSLDPEGRTLAYDWFLGNGTITLTPEEACAQEIKQKANGSTLIYLGQGTTYRYAVPTGVASPMNIQLVVRDPGCLYATRTKTVTIP